MNKHMLNVSTTFMGELSRLTFKENKNLTLNILFINLTLII